MLKLQQLSRNDGRDIYQMLQGIEKNENSFTNPVKDMPYEKFREWLCRQDDWSRGDNLPQGYVSQTIYWLMDDEIPVGMGKIRHKLTAQSRESGGNIGYAISEGHRGKGYGNTILGLLLDESVKLNVMKPMLTVDKNNYPSRKVIEKNGGELFRENEERWYFYIDCTQRRRTDE